MACNVCKCGRPKDCDMKYCEVCIDEKEAGCPREST